jgi:hypothetical protein
MKLNPLATMRLMGTGSKLSWKYPTLDKLFVAVTNDKNKIQFLVIERRQGSPTE